MSSGPVTASKVKTTLDPLPLLEEAEAKSILWGEKSDLVGGFVACHKIDTSEDWWVTALKISLIFADLITLGLLPAGALIVCRVVDLFRNNDYNLKEKALTETIDALAKAKLAYYDGSYQDDGIAPPDKVTKRTEYQKAFDEAVRLLFENLNEVDLDEKTQIAAWFLRDLANCEDLDAPFAEALQSDLRLKMTQLLLKEKILADPEMLTHPQGMEEACKTLARHLDPKTAIPDLSTITEEVRGYIRDADDCEGLRETLKNFIPQLHAHETADSERVKEGLRHQVAEGILDCEERIAALEPALEELTKKRVAYGALTSDHPDWSDFVELVTQERAHTTELEKLRTLLAEFREHEKEAKIEELAQREIDRERERVERRIQEINRLLNTTP